MNVLLKMLFRVSIGVCALVCVCPLPAQPPAAGERPAADATPLAWPKITRECRPWAYNWWMGSAVDRANLARELRRYREGGLGGIHIVPIYGAHGAESRYIDYLSPAWTEMLRFAVEEADRNDLGVDMTTGTGWCFGGPQVPAKDGCLWASVSPDGQFSVKSANVKVKRAGPGGAGPMINPFHGAAMEEFLRPFTLAFDRQPKPLPRAMYHDSFEYRSNWSPDLLDEFHKRRGYRLKDQAVVLAGGEPIETLARVRCDYRETLSDMLVENVFPRWIRWCRQRGIATRNQAHGAPANLLDFYAMADIPETEMFGRGTRDPLVSRFDERFAEGDRDVLISKFASSAAHVANRRLTSAETGTWMAEHFCETLEEMKCLVDLFFVAGVNHVFYHGTCYSPDDAAWPGWLFYASTQMNPRNSIWRDAPALNAYIARSQAMLQSGAPDNDVLLYWPIHDLWQSTEKPQNPLAPIACSVHDHGWLRKQPIGAAAARLWSRGWGFDYVSDRQLAEARSVDGAVRIGNASWRAVVVPHVQLMPVTTMERLLALASQGATIIFEDGLPTDVPGFGDLEKRREQLRGETARLRGKAADESPLQVAPVDRGRIIIGPLEASLTRALIARESLVDHAGAMVLRRRHADGRSYFVVNQSTKLMDGWFELATPAAAVVIMDALTGRTGVGQTKAGAEGRTAIRLVVEPGGSLILRSFDRPIAGPAWNFAQSGAVASELEGPWRVKFIAGGPELPKPYQLEKLDSWTNNGDPETSRFAGAAVYATTFAAPATGGPWLLDLGKVCHSARVRVNGKESGTVFMSPYRVVVADLKPTGNTLEVEVTNLSANRIRDMDRRQVAWRVFRDANVVNIRYGAFDASNWPVQDSGLLGPVGLSALVLSPEAK